MTNVELTDRQKQAEAEQTAMLAEDYAKETGDAEDWKIAARIWKNAGNNFKYNFCMGMAEASD